MALTLDQLKKTAYGLDLTDNEVAQVGNVRHKSTWKQAIELKRKLNDEQAMADRALAAEAEEENRQARLDAIYQSPGAALIVPVASVAAYGHGLVNSFRRCL